MSTHDGMASEKKKIRKSNKWMKTEILMKSDYIRSHIPQTKKLTRDHLYSMLQLHEMVYIKPVHGSLGRGVIRIEKLDSKYSCHIREMKHSYHSFEALYAKILTVTKGESYIVQKGIRSLRYHGRISDLRVVVQRTPNGSFEVSGICVRVAPMGRVVSNGGRGGMTVPLYYLIGSRPGVERRIENLSKAVMKQVRKRYKGQKEIGIDIALDSNLKPWILEYNFNPDHSLFASMRDQSMIRRILYNGAMYGRRYRLKGWRRY